MARLGLSTQSYTRCSWCGTLAFEPADISRNVTSQGFGLTIGSDFYLVFDARARLAYYREPTPTSLVVSHGQFTPLNGSFTSPIGGTLSIGNVSSYEMQHVVDGAKY